ncbi:MAG: hypothetical protein PHY29_06265 [Syntrophales bacterium]|nr:hypothetical protein [Syntrophales bacterium]
MQYVEIRFSRTRTVYIDGVESGPTNTILRIGAGTHLFDLGWPADYLPPEVIRRIHGTNELKPIIIEFDEVPL